MSGRHYLDYASTAPLRPEAAAAIGEWISSDLVGDPGRVYSEARAVRDAIEEARRAVAALTGFRPREVLFTASGTEAINTACFGVLTRSSEEGPILCAGVEHSAVRLASERHRRIVELAVDRFGRVDLAQLKDILGLPVGQRPVLVHCQVANHEVGTLQPVSAVVDLCRAHGVTVHVDACAARGQLPIDLAALGADLCSVSAHKFGGPPGVGALLLRRGLRLAPFVVGGDQERGRRAGMENVPGILGFGAVAEALSAPGRLQEDATLAQERTDRMLEAAVQLPGVRAFGDPVDRLPHLICLGCDDVEAEGVVLGLDQAGIAVHSGSACSSEAFAPSPVLEAMGVAADHSIRCSVGWATTENDVGAFVEQFPTVLERLRLLRS